MSHCTMFEQKLHINWSLDIEEIRDFLEPKNDFTLESYSINKKMALLALGRIESFLVGESKRK